MRVTHTVVLTRQMGFHGVICNSVSDLDIRQTFDRILNSDVLSV